MRNSALRLVVALIAFAVGLAADSLWPNARNSTTKSGPCREGLVVVEHQPDAPVGISIMSIGCSDGFANINYKVIGRTDRLIRKVEIGRSSAHQGIVDYDAHGSSSISVVPGGLTAADLEHNATGEGIKLSRGWFREPVHEVRYSVRCVTFTDGSVWRSANE